MLAFYACYIFEKFDNSLAVKYFKLSVLANSKIISREIQ